MHYSFLWNRFECYVFLMIPNDPKAVRLWISYSQFNVCPIDSISHTQTNQIKSIHWTESIKELSVHFSRSDELICNQMQLIMISLLNGMKWMCNMCVIFIRNWFSFKRNERARMDFLILLMQLRHCTSRKAQSTHIVITQFFFHEYVYRHLFNIQRVY